MIDLIAQIIIPIIVIKVLVFNKNSKIKPNFIEKSKGYTTIGNVKLIYNSERKLTKMNQVILLKAKNNWNEWHRSQKNLQLKKGVWSYSDPILFSLSLSDSYVVYANSMNQGMSDQGIDEGMYPIDFIVKKQKSEVLSSEPSSESKSKAVDIKIKFNINDHQKALGYILSTIDEDLHEHVSGINVVCLMMDTLKMIMDDVSKPTKVWYKV